MILSCMKINSDREDLVRPPNLPLPEIEPPDGLSKEQYSIRNDVLSPIKSSPDPLSTPPEYVYPCYYYLATKNRNPFLFRAQHIASPQNRVQAGRGSVSHIIGDRYVAQQWQMRNNGRFCNRLCRCPCAAAACDLYRSTCPINRSRNSNNVLFCCVCDILRPRSPMWDLRRYTRYTEIG